MEGYGQTECTVALATGRDDAQTRINRKTVAGLNIEIIDETGSLEIGYEGEIVIILTDETASMFRDITGMMNLQEGVV